ncbi:MAG: ABC transporter ATP-binding protein [Actinobacteria bacterium]|nr:ABC transporter ATP-binding protein [Actinomycetota bacterium]NBR65944.1 ABC transporter ATP-binding protein [Actinomycetota bacterium]
MLVALLRRQLSAYRSVLWLVVAFQAVQSAAGLWLPTLNADIIDKGVARGDQAYIWRIGAVMVCASLVQLVFSVAAVKVGSKAAMGFGRDTRRDLFHQVNDFSSREVNQFGPPSLITRITNDVQQVQMLVLMTCTLLLAAPFTAVGGVILAMRQDIGLSWIFIVTIPLVLLAQGSIIVRMTPTFRVMQEKIDRINEILREQLTGIRVVRAFVREPEETVRFRDGNDSLTRTALKGGRLQSLMFPTVSLFVNMASVAVVWFGADQIGSGRMRNIGALIAFLTYLTQILMSVMMATYMAALVPRASVSAERIMEVLDTPSSVVSASDPVRITAPRASLEMRNVGFHYPGAEHAVLEGISFVCRPGEMLAVIGSTGSGKTTLINLVPRLFDATSGAVLVDGVDVRELAPEDLWSRVGLVPQKPYLFSGTVASNLRYGREDATEDEMWEALRVAQAEDFVRTMDGGLEAAVAQGGSNLSGGQRQRLAIARALVRRPDIYLFDDSFSALDLATDARLRAALAPRVTDAAVVVVAQRVSTIRNADRILVLEDGEAVGLGTHEQLLESCPTYIEIVESQASINEEEPV